MIDGHVRFSLAQLAVAAAELWWAICSSVTALRVSSSTISVPWCELFCRFFLASLVSRVFGAES